MRINYIMNLNKYLNGNINNIIYKYIDYSFENIIKNFNPVRIDFNNNLNKKDYKLKNYTTFEDILTIIFRHGYKSFYVNKFCKNIKEQINNMKKPYFISKSYDYMTIIYYDIKGYDGYSCDLLNFDHIIEE